jgi:hypothetical protein
MCNQSIGELMGLSDAIIGLTSMSSPLKLKTKQDKELTDSLCYR